MTEPIDVSELTNEQLLEEIEAQAGGATPRFAYSTEWLSRLLKGKVKTEQFDHAQQRGFKRLLPRLLAAFTAGNLFGCQGLDFTSMLMCKEQEVEHDQRLWNSVESMLTVNGLRGTKEHQELWDFATTRILLSYKTRRSFLEETGAPKLELSEAKAKSKETMRKEFERVGVQWKWWWRTWDKVEQEKLKAEYGVA